MPVLERLLSVVVEVAVLLIAVSAHESAHGWVAEKWGDTTARDLGRITLNPIKHLDPVGSLMVPAVLAISGLPVFGWARPVPVNPLNLRDPRRAMVRVSVAGPAANLILALASLVALRLLRMVAPGLPQMVIDNLSGGALLHGGLLGVVVAVLTASLIINVILAVFNLMPIPPMDGAGIVEGFLPPSAAASYRRLGRYGFLIVLGLLWLGAFDIVFRPVMIFVLRLVIQ